MDIKDFFDSTFSNITEDCSCPDHETAFKDVLERAEKMKEQSTSKTLTEVHVPSMPYIGRKHTALRAVAGTAAAVAVIGGSVWGINFLNEHGGLKGPDVQGAGAGYHEDTTVTEPAQESKDILDAVGDVIEFEDMTATIEQVLYDGHTLRVIYRVDSYDERYYGSPADATICLEDVSEVAGEKYYRGGGGNTYDKYLDNTDHRNVVSVFRELSEGESARFKFSHYERPLSEDGSSDILRFSGAYTLNGIDASKNSFTVNNLTVPVKEIGGSDAYSGKGEIDSLTLTPLGALILTRSDMVSYDLCFGIKYRDGSVTDITNVKDGTALLTGGVPEYNGIYSVTNSRGIAKEYLGLKTDIPDGSSMITVESYLYDPIDVNNIASVIINGEEIPLNVYTGMELDDASELLTKNNIGYEVNETASDDIPEGCIIRTEPEFGLLDEAPGKVTLYVSTGTEAAAGIDINDTIEFSDCTVNVSGIERYGNTVKLTLDAYAKENCDMNDVGFCVYEYHEDDEPENRVYKATFSDLGDTDNGHLREEIVFFPDLPEGAERTYSLRKYHYSKSENDETITFSVTGEDYNNIYSDDHEYVGNGIEGEEIRISSIKIDPLTISFLTDSFNFRSLADSFNLSPNFSVKLKNGETMTYDKCELTDDNGKTICSFSEGIYDTSGENIRYIFIATDPIFHVNEIESINILGAEIPITTE